MAAATADGTSASDNPNRILVYLRIRPPKKAEISAADGQTYFFDVGSNHKTTTLVGVGKTYEFDWVFEGADVLQQDIYNRVALPVVDNVFKGYWGTMMVYGQTGSGKSYTMCTFEPENEQGIIPRTMTDAFARIEADTSRQYTITFSFIQIYLDKLQDLFNPDAPKELSMTRDATGIKFPGIVEHVVSTEAQFQQLYESANQHRVVRETRINPISSRGHAALFIQVKSVSRDDPGGEVRNGKLFLIDLAGYERFEKTGVQEGIMKEEAKCINSSLLALGGVVSALSERSEHIPWRNVKLTRMLEDAIGGRARCSIILTAGPSSEHQFETLGTMYFGSRAMDVKTNAKPAINIDYPKLAKKLQEMLRAAETRITGLEAEAAKRQLEREELEARFQSEWANVKKRQDDALQGLLKNGASPEKVQEAIKANHLESDMLEEQHYVQRSALQEAQDDILKQQLARSQHDIEADEQRVRAGADMDLAALRRHIATLQDERDKWKAKAKAVEAEVTVLREELTEERLKASANMDDLRDSGGSSPRLSASEVRKEMDRRIASLKEMLEEQHEAARLQVEEPLRDELDRVKGVLSELQATFDERIMAQKDALTQMHEEELSATRRKSADTQEKLKKNHATIKKSYQTQNQQLQDEVEQLLRKLGDPAAKSFAAATSPTNDATAMRVGSVSVAELMILKKQSEKRVEELSQRNTDLLADLEYANAEIQGLKNQLSEYDVKPGEERIQPAVVRRMKDDLDKARADKENVERELLNVKVCRRSTTDGPDELDDDDTALEVKPDIAGDFEGLEIFSKNLLKFPFTLAGAQRSAIHSHLAVLNTLTTDLGDYREAMRVRMLFIGDLGSGKSSVVKCFTTTPPLIKAVPGDVTTTTHPTIRSGSVEDPATSGTDLHKVYIQGEELAEREQRSGVLGSVASWVGIGAASAAVSSPAKVYVDILDCPGAPSFWRGANRLFFPAKNVVYCVAYKLTNTLDAIKEEVVRYLELIHAMSVPPLAQKPLGGDAPRTAVCLIGTHRDGLRDPSDAAVVALLNRVTTSLGEAFYRLRGDSTRGVVCVGNFAVSCRDWTVMSSGKRARGPQTPKDLFSWIALTAQQLSPIRPSEMLPPAVREMAVQRSYALLGDEPIDECERWLERPSLFDEWTRRCNRGLVTLVSWLNRESKVRWVIGDAEFRSAVEEHLGLTATEMATTVTTVNYVIRELQSRGVIGFLPLPLYEPKYLPPTDGGGCPLRDGGTIVLDPLRLLSMYSAFMSPRTLADLPPSGKEDKTQALYNVDVLTKHASQLHSGIITTEVGQQILQRFLGLTGQDVKLLFEVICVMGLAVAMKKDTALVSPVHFRRGMVPGFVDYLSFLLSCHGDGQGRKYELNVAGPAAAAFFARLQVKLIPFSHGVASEASLIAAGGDLNWVDGSYLCFDKARLKHGCYTSHAVKEAVMQSKLPARGILRLEGNQILIAITARGSGQAALDAVAGLLKAVHHEIVALCKREFRGVRWNLRAVAIDGFETKRDAKVFNGIAAILTRMGAPPALIKTQQDIIGTLDDAKGGEIDSALATLPACLLTAEDQD